MAAVTLRIPDAVYEKYKSMNSTNPSHALESQLAKYQDASYKDRTLVFSDEVRRDLEKLFGRPIEDPAGFVKWLTELITIKVGGMDFPLKPGQLKGLHGKATFFKKEFEEFARPYISRILDRDLGGF